MLWHDVAPCGRFTFLDLLIAVAISEWLVSVRLAFELLGQGIRLQVGTFSPSPCSTTCTPAGSPDAINMQEARLVSLQRSKYVNWCFLRVDVCCR